MTCSFKKYTLHFKKPGGTSRGVLHQKDTYFLCLSDGEKTAYGECNLFRGLSYDDREGYEKKLTEVCTQTEGKGFDILNELKDWPSIAFGVETVLKDFENGGRQVIYPEVIGDNGFSVPINGLIWMGEKAEMQSQIDQKLNEGFHSIKLKIGAIDFQTELDLLKYIRKQASPEQVELRVDANGAWSFSEAQEKLKQLGDLDINYIEQPIKAGQWQEMAALVADSRVKIALDEELIGIIETKQKEALIQTIHPDLLILKPALVGGFAACNEWKNLIEKDGGEWVITSALESNIGLNAIAQYTAGDLSDYAQGLGTGQLYLNNIPSPYTVDAHGLHYHKDGKWDFSPL